MLERTVAITNEVLEPITFVLAYTTVFIYRISWVRNWKLHDKKLSESLFVTITIFSWMKWRQLQRNLVGISGCRNKTRDQDLYSKERRILATTGRHSTTLLSTQQCKTWTLHFNTGETKVRQWAHTSISPTQPHILIPSSAYIALSSFQLLFGLPSARFPKKLSLRILHVGLSEPNVYPAGFNFHISNWTKLFKRLI